MRGRATGLHYKIHTIARFLTRHGAPSQRSRAFMQIVYLSCAVTLPEAPNRREDGFEHDQMMAALRPPIEARGGVLIDLAWDDAAVDWSAFDAVVIGTAWDYWDRQEEFLATLQQIEAKTRLFNPSRLVRWNSRKTYLKDLEARGTRILPTLWVDAVTVENAKAAFDHFQADDLVFKRQVGAGADGQYRLERGDSLPTMSHPMMVQPFIPAIKEEGEFSFIFIDGDVSHALVKRAAKNDYRIQSLYGGTEEKIIPPKEDLKAARAVFESLDETPLYARVDMVRGSDGHLMLMEIELIEPFLYPEQSEALGERMARALVKRIS